MLLDLSLEALLAVLDSRRGDRICVPVLDFLLGSASSRSFPGPVLPDLRRAAAFRQLVLEALEPRSAMRARAASAARSLDRRGARCASRVRAPAFELRARSLGFLFRALRLREGLRNRPLSCGRRAQRRAAQLAEPGFTLRFALRTFRTSSMGSSMPPTTSRSGDHHSGRAHHTWRAILLSVIGQHVHEDLGVPRAGHDPR